MKKHTDSIIIATAIIFSGVLISFSLVSMNGFSVSSAPSTNKQIDKQEEAPRAVTRTDHIQGDINAKLVIVEYSDTECPFCKNFHSTMNRIINEYGPSKKVAWVYRHMPIKQLHAKAPKEAEATECAAELGGNGKFWEYTNKLYEITPSNDGLDPAELTKIAEQVGLNTMRFNSCLSSGKHAKTVDADYKDGVLAIGGNPGTPFSVIITKDGKKVPINGAQPYEVVKEMIDGLLK